MHHAEGAKRPRTPGRFCEFCALVSLRSIFQLYIEIFLIHLVQLYIIHQWQ